MELLSKYLGQLVELHVVTAKRFVYTKETVARVDGYHSTGCSAFEWHLGTAIVDCTTRSAETWHSGSHYSSWYDGALVRTS